MVCPAATLPPRKSTVWSVARLTTTAKAQSLSAGADRLDSMALPPRLGLLSTRHRNRMAADHKRSTRAHTAGGPLPSPFANRVPYGLQRLLTYHTAAPGATVPAALDVTMPAGTRTWSLGEAPVPEEYPSILGSSASPREASQGCSRSLLQCRSPRMVERTTEREKIAARPRSPARIPRPHCHRGSKRHRGKEGAEAICHHQSSRSVRSRDSRGTRHRRSVGLNRSSAGARA